MKKTGKLFNKIVERDVLLSNDVNCADDRYSSVQQDIDELTEELGERAKSTVGLMIELLSKDANQKVVPGLELLEGTVAVPVRLSVEQYLWLTQEGEDIHGDLSEFIQTIVDERMKVCKAHPYNQQKALLVAQFKKVLSTNRWDLDGLDTTLSHLKRMLDLAKTSKELEDAERALQSEVSRDHSKR